MYVNRLKTLSRGILLLAKEGGCPGVVRSDHMVLKTVRQEAGPRGRLPKPFKH
jgi:hypothetical protein